MKRLLLAGLWVGFLALISCSEKPTENVKEFEVTGVVHEVNDDGGRLIIDHEEIPGYMPRMIMPFKVKDAREGKRLKAGDEISFLYRVEAESSWIESIEKTGRFVEIEVPNLMRPSTRLLELGEQMADYQFLDQDGAQVSLSAFEGNVVAITFVFSRCPVPEYCPRMMRNFNQVAKSLESNSKIDGNWRLLTISFDPEYDSPEVLAAYGDAFGQESDKWLLLTSEDVETVNQIAGNVGLKFGKSNGSYLHNLRTVVLDKERKLQNIFTDENWSPDELIKAIESVAEAEEEVN